MSGPEPIRLTRAEQTPFDTPSSQNPDVRLRNGKPITESGESGVLRHASGLGHHDDATLGLLALGLADEARRRHDIVDDLALKRVHGR
jgi:hypothetical protein